jgi:hypothetical protein
MATQHRGRDAGASRLTQREGESDAPGSTLATYWTVMVAVIEEWKAQW